ncbi:MAG: anaerobic ribonucleoside-triphosphate reductase activating protein [Clostridia bacterium]|nr:anaerobic ribonucleoside-triphosphate reductase activating protein [Clostridia bacterium]
MKIFGLQKLSLLDFPGKMACTVFTGGCNLRCPFCHNASLVTGLSDVEPIEESEVFDLLRKRRGILEGVAITGGEPLLQPDIEDFIRRVRAQGCAVKLDTNGCYPDRLGRILAEKLVDYVAMDIKNAPDAYAKTVGVEGFDLSPVQKSVELLMNGGVDYEFRTTVVKELHSAADFEKIGQWLKGAKRLYLQSFKDSGDLIGSGLSACTSKELEQFRQILLPYIPDTFLRGVD